MSFHYKTSKRSFLVTLNYSQKISIRWYF